MITRRDFLKVTGVAAAAAALTACGGSSSTASSAASGTASSAAASAVAKLDKVKVAVPNDTTNEARALTLLEKNGFFKLKADAGLTATAKDIEENPLNVTVDEVEAAQVPNVLQDEDYAVINSNYAISAGLDPMTDALAMEDGSSAYVNILVCKDGNQEEPKIKALAAALQSQKVKDFMDENYKGAVVSVVENPTDGYDSFHRLRCTERRDRQLRCYPGSPTARFWRSARTFWPKRASRWIFRSTTTTSSPTTSLRTASAIPTTSSISRIWTTSMQSTAPIW